MTGNADVRLGRHDVVTGAEKTVAEKEKTLADALVYESEQKQSEQKRAVGPIPAGRMQIVALADVPMQSAQWVWPLYLPHGKFVVADGLPGQGKTAVAIDIAARLSRGAAMPDGSAGIGVADSLILTYEDDAATTLRPRLEAAGGDATRVHHVEGVSYNSDDLLLPPTLPKDLALLETALRERPNIRFVVIDPIMAALGNEIDSNSDQSIRRVLARLARMAEQFGVCILVIRHVKKAHGGNSITAGGGSIGIIGQARVGLLVDRHPEDPNAAVLAVVKNNLGPLAPSLTFRKVSTTVRSATGEAISTFRLEWTGAANLTADELLSAHDGGESGGAAEREIDNWLRGVLDGAPVDRRELFRAALDAGFPSRSVERSANRVQVVRHQSGFGKDKHSTWALPAPHDTPPAPISHHSPRLTGPSSLPSPKTRSISRDGVLVLEVLRPTQNGDKWFLADAS